MAVPIFEDEGIVAVIGVGNKPEDYNQYDIDLLSILTESLWSLVRKKRFDEELIRINEELEQRVERRTRDLAQANKDLESFSYSVSHDLRAPLRHISGYVNLLNRPSALTDDEKRRHYMDMILDSSRHMGQLIDDLLVFSRVGRTELRKEAVNLNELIEDVVAKRKTEIWGRTVNWEIAELPQVSGDRNMLRIVMDNLISNALKYTRRESVAEIEIGCCEGEDNRTVVSIRDNGVGFNMDYAHKLFGVFQRLHSDEEFEGTGIGLATVERIIRRHGGTVWAESRDGEGATFSFSIQSMGTK
jgi:light-regulated signal transduction histidine kinase (bacteriophytochrome)